MKRTDRRTVFRHQLIYRPAHSDVCALGYVVRGVEGSEFWVGPLECDIIVRTNCQNSWWGWT
jgi:hypothetical protein